MKYSIKELRELVKQTITETYLGTSQLGGLASPAFNKIGPDYDTAMDVPVDPVDLAHEIRALIGGDAGFPIGDWGDEALNAAAEAAADALINDKQRQKTPNSVRLPMYEKRNLINEELQKVKQILNEQDMSAYAEKLYTALETIIKTLNSMDMSLDLVYSAVSGHEGPISSISSLQKHYGRAMAASRAPAPAGTEE